MDRREFIRFLLQGLVATAGLSLSNVASGQTADSQRAIQFFFAQVKYRGGDWNPHPLSVTPMMEELMLRTSVEAATVRHEIGLSEPELFRYPFLYITGRYDFDPFTETEVENLRLFLSYGGFLLIDDALGQPGYGFDRSMRREMKRIFPEHEFRRIPTSHAALRSYYLVRRMGGMKVIVPHLEGMTIGNSTPVVYCQNNLGGAWERDQLGRWINPCTPGGEEQRRAAFHLGINLILYAMTENYKEDLIHVPFIRKRLAR